jgi:hypothetical protein
MSQVTIRRPFGELDLRHHLSSRAESTDNDNGASGLFQVSTASDQASIRATFGTGTGDT